MAAYSIVVENLRPILRVDDLDRSVRFYCDQLGFIEEWRMGGMAGVARDEGRLMLCEGEQGHAGTWIWIGVEDAAAMHAELTARQVEFRHGPRNFPWALEFKVCDPDGHMLRFGSEPIEGRPYDDWAE